MAPTIPASIPFSLGPPLVSSPLPTAPQISMAGSSRHVSTIAQASVISSLDAPAPSRVTGGFSATGSSPAAVSVFVDLIVGLPSGADAVLDGRLATLLVLASSTHSRHCAVVILAGSLFGGTSDAGALETATFSCQLAAARCQRDVACHEAVSVRSEPHCVRDEIDKLRLALTPF